MTSFAKVVQPVVPMLFGFAVSYYGVFKLNNAVWNNRIILFIFHSISYLFHIPYIYYCLC